MLAMRSAILRIKGWASTPRLLEWSCLVAAAVLVVRYRWILDDAFVAYRYVDNFLFLKLGLVYNPGEYVEGYSSPLWVGLLIGLRALELSYETIIMLVGLTTLLVIWCMLVALRREQSPPGAVLNLPMVLLLPNYAFLCYLTGGADAPLSLLMGVGYALFITRPTSVPLQLLVALSPTIRHEFFIPYALCLLWVWWGRRRFPWLLFITGGAALGGWLAFRIYYYADLFPVTFYLKNADNLKWGVLYVHDTMVAYHAYEIVAVMVVLFAFLAYRGLLPDWSRRAMMLLVAAPVVLYVVKIGGDARHFKYLAFPYCLMLCAFGGLPERAWSSLGWRSPRIVMPTAGLLLAFVTFTCHPRQLDRHPLRAEVEYQMVDGITDAHVHRTKIIPRYREWSERVTPDILRAFRSSPAFEARWEIVPDHLCVRNYMAFDKRIVHTWGMTDAVLARADVPAKRAGHKPALLQMGRWIARMANESTESGPRMLSRLGEAGEAPAWVRDNLNAIRLIEDKVYNRHNFAENLRLALHPPVVRLTITSPSRER